MKRLIPCMLILCMLCSFVGCSAENANGGNTLTPNTNQDSSGTQPEDPDAAVTPLTAEELKSWTDYFNKLENNGLLRFPYADPAQNPDALLYNLHWLFYDIGEHESTFTDEEKALLDEAGLWLELDSFRLTREFINDYLFTHFNITEEAANTLLHTAKLGIYLNEYDAWYISHGDTAYSSYSITDGWVCANGTICLRYFNDFLGIALGNGDHDFVSSSMLITLIPREDGTCYIVSHEMESGLWE